jgi:hypothetical protein
MEKASPMKPPEDEEEELIPEEEEVDTKTYAKANQNNLKSIQLD